MIETKVILRERKKEEESGSSIPFGTFVVTPGGMVILKTETEYFVDISSGCVYTLEEFNEEFPKFRVINTLDVWFEV